MEHIGLFMAVLILSRRMRIETNSENRDTIWL